MFLAQARRSFARLVGAAPALLGMTLAVGCAHAPLPAVDAGLAKAAQKERSALRPRPQVYRPQSRAEARGMLERAFEAAENEAHPLAVALFGAVLATDFVTDRGRTNLYWMLAESLRILDDEGERASALGGFLIASELLADPGEDVLLRRMMARAQLAAQRVECDPGFGRSPTAAISVEDLREPASIMGSLSCGAEGREPYVDVVIRSVHEGHNQLLQRRAECRSSGRVLELWFDVTHARLGGLGR
jgi:hypothetical protein